MNDAAIEYLSDQQCSRQWKGFLRAFAEEFTAQWSAADLQALMRRLGSRFAQEHSLDPCNTLGDLQLEMGRVWIGIDWGWVALDQRDDHLQILHHCAPLRAGLGASSMAWAGSFLEGAYQQWFADAAADEALQVRQAAVAPVDAGTTIELRLARG